MCSIWTVKTPAEKPSIYHLHCYTTVYLPELSSKLKTVFVYCFLFLPPLPYTVPLSLSTSVYLFFSSLPHLLLLYSLPLVLTSVIENWVGLCWLGRICGLLHAAGPFFSSLGLVILCQPSPSRAARVSDACSVEVFTASSHPTVFAPLWQGYRTAAVPRSPLLYNVRTYNIHPVNSLLPCSSYSLPSLSHSDPFPSST